MKQLRLFLIVLMTVAALSLAACGGGGDGGGTPTTGGNDGGGDDDGNGNGDTVVGTTFTKTLLASLDGGTFSAGIAINSDGLAVGFSDDGASVKGTRWTVTDSTPTATALEPLSSSVNAYSAAYGVNDQGIAVGESGTTVDSVTDANTVAVFWPSGGTAATILGTGGLFEGGASAAFSINDGGEIVGEAENDAEGRTVAVYWADTAADPLILGNLPGGDFSSAYFIGADGRIVGESRNSEGLIQAVMWVPAVGGSFDAPFALNALNGQIGSVALGIDLDARIVGEAELESGEIHGVVWNADGTIAEDLGAHTSASAINNANRTQATRPQLQGTTVPSSGTPWISKTTSIWPNPSARLMGSTTAVSLSASVGCRHL